MPSLLNEEGRMKGIDTNVLIRYLVQDDKEQSQLATQFIENEPLIFINGMVLCELVWVLETAYEYNKKEIIPVIEQILRTRQFHIHESDLLWQAWRGYKHDGADFADHYIGSLNTHHGCECTLTFDKKAAQLKYFKAVSSIKL